MLFPAGSAAAGVISLSSSPRLGCRARMGCPIAFVTTSAFVLGAEVRFGRRATVDGRPIFSFFNSCTLASVWFGAGVNSFSQAGIYHRRTE